MFCSFACLILGFLLVFGDTPPAAALPVPDTVPLPAAGPSGGVPTALASADLDADGVPDLIVAYAAGDATTLVVYPGDHEAVYPSVGQGRALATTPFAAPQVLTTVAGTVATLTAVDVDADGLKDLIAERAGADASMLAGFGDGAVGEEEPLAAAVVVAARARAASLAPRNLVAAEVPALRTIPAAFHATSGGGDVLGYRPSAAVRRVLARPRTSIALRPPADATAVLSMRLNRDAIPDLVVLRPGSSTPEVVLSRAVATLLVTTTKDESGACDASCSLREAIVAANATPEPDVIEFAIPASDPGFQPLTGSWLIQPKGTLLPVITAPVTIDGRTQPGFAGEPVIELSGELAEDGAAGLDIAASNTVVRGLVVSGWPALRENGESFCGCGIAIAGADNCIIEGNYVGTDATGMQVKPNGQNGVAVIVGSNNLVGGTTAAARNVISGMRDQFFFEVGTGTFMSSTTVNNTFAGNYIGVDKTGFGALPNRIAVLLNSANNTVGGTDPGSGNVIAGNAEDMVTIFEAAVSADGNKVLRNYLGVNVSGIAAFNEGFGCGVRTTGADNTVVGSPGNGNLIAGNDCGVAVTLGTVRSTSGHLIQGNVIGPDALGRPLGNSGAGVSLVNAFNATVGGVGAGEGNVIAHNTGGPGVVVSFVNTCPGCTSGTFRGNQNRILSNVIFNNLLRGIDLANQGFGDGVTANDAGDADAGANDLLNWPVLTGASSDANSSMVNAEALTIGPASAQPYTLQFFANPACDTAGGNGEGRIFLGEASRMADGAPVVVNLGVPVPNGYVVTATATDSLGNTSEFSNCVQANGGPAPVASATPTPVPSATPSKTALPGQTPTVAPTNIVGVETCDNCRDDDGDTLVDRDDPDCPRPRVYGYGAGVPGNKRAKTVSKCQKAVSKAGQAYVTKLQKLLQKCLQQALACVELKGGDPACLAKAGTTCQKAVDARDPLDDKAEAKIEKACSTPPVLAPDLVNPAGLGYLGERSTCQASPVFVFNLDDADDLGRCVTGLHECQVAQLVSQETPRARELLQLVGVNPSSFTCLLNPGANGGGQGVGDPAQAKALVKCAKGVQKSAAKFGKTRLSGLQKCLAAVVKCVQEKPGDAKCLTGARSKCLKIAAKIGDEPKAAGGKARAAIVKACNGAGADLLDAVGLGQTSTAAYCAAVGVPALTTASEVADCLIRHHHCRIGQLLDTETPRARELLDIVGVVP